jgi:hypothetical protein
MALATCKDVERWYEKSYQVVERIDYINTVQKDRDVEEHGIRVLRDRNISRIRKETRYWVSMAHEPDLEIHMKWAECKKIWENINRGDERH